VENRKGAETQAGWEGVGSGWGGGEEQTISEKEKEATSGKKRFCFHTPIREGIKRRDNNLSWVGSVLKNSGRLLISCDL